ncbi:hypothetical protein PF010_g28160 [Phytophthora fragariae]|uniref:Secreted protein n=1 Tax=Phytophthora fragariae TaxID=53985 RepID=A0A6A3HBH0_9STRA|nr:hypothetical protein PF003_g39904 [Phytophthora fragariae]KAE8920181.1 hypothetical protein PF009_g29523 [Phytophthora fragariae]KAE8966620.1 hypothetical protein PF011_g27870 [Phytophthora fragariae]KAE9064567.1 hypothetical protein PF007_g29153 [Phytophthora fragariae]KAE9065524.1 hypothetical protein PF010_g28160 [Phytophthora fragariae]
MVSVAVGLISCMQCSPAACRGTCSHGRVAELCGRTQGNPQLNYALCGSTQWNASLSYAVCDSM